MLGKDSSLVTAAAAFAVSVVVAAASSAATVQFDYEDPLFRLLTAPPQSRFAVAAELVLDPDTVSTEAIRQQVSVAPLKYLFRASRTAQAALDFVLLKRDGAAIPLPEADSATRPPNVLLISVAGLRADFVGAYGQKRPTTPRIDALADQGALFTSAYSTSAWSIPGTGSLLTSLYPSRHGLESEGTARDSRLDRGATTLAEAFAGAGYDTAAVVGDTRLAGPRGFADGFDLHLEREASAVELAALARLWFEWHLFHASRGLEAGSFFLFLQFADIDLSDSDAPAAYRAIFPPADPSPQGEAAAAYAAKVRAVDDQVGVVLDALDVLGLTGRTAVVVTASHGYELGERGAYGAGQSLFDEQLHVPLVVRLPDTVAPAQRIPGVASILDVMPTLLAWTGVPVPPGVAGDGLAGIVRAPGEETQQAIVERDLYAELGPAEREWSRPFHERAIRSGGLKMLVRRNPDGTNSRLLFDVRADPGELRDLAADASRQTSLADLENRLREHMAAAPTRTPPQPTATPGQAVEAADPGHAHSHDK
jgi:arylsulfatase A-like enzyme